MSEKEPKFGIRIEDRSDGSKIFRVVDKRVFEAPELGPANEVNEEKIQAELKQMQEAWDDALERLSDTHDAEAGPLLEFTNSTPNPSEVEAYLKDHPELSEEGKHFLRTSIQIKKIREKLNAFPK